MSHMRRPKALDLFCGCGGISCGLERAGFEVVAGVDLEPHYIQTYRKNFGSARTLRADLLTLEPEQLGERYDIRKGDVTLLAGGPPCQGFSKNVPRSQRLLEDPRNRLVSRFLDYCEAFAPEAVLLENVAEMKNGFDKAYTDEIVERLSELDYGVSSAVLNAADYGVPQRRRRAFFVGLRGGRRFAFPKPSHFATTSNDALFTISNHVSVWEAISDLPSLQHGGGMNGLQPYRTEPQNEFQTSVREGAALVTNHVARRLQPTQFERIMHLEPGDGHADLPARLQVKGGYSGAYGRLTTDMVAPTITRWSFHPGSGRWGHPIDRRLLSIREIARIQGFPDSFVFEGTFTQCCGQLGNAVPPSLARIIGETILTQLLSVTYESRSTPETLLL